MSRYGNYFKLAAEIRECFTIFNNKTKANLDSFSPDSDFRLLYENLNYDTDNNLEEPAKKSKEKDKELLDQFKEIYTKYYNVLIESYIKKASNPKLVKKDVDDNIIPYNPGKESVHVIAEYNAMMSSIFNATYKDFLTDETKKELEASGVQPANLFRSTQKDFENLGKKYTVADDKAWKLQRENKYTSKNLMEQLKSSNALKEDSISEEFIINYVNLKTQYKKRGFFEKAFASSESRTELKAAEEKIREYILKNHDVEGPVDDKFDYLAYAKSKLASSKTLENVILSASPEVSTDNKEYLLKLGVEKRPENVKSPEEKEKERKEMVEFYKNQIVNDRNYNPEELDKDQIRYFNEAVKSYNFDINTKMNSKKAEQLADLKKKALDVYKKYGKFENEESKQKAITEYEKLLNSKSSRNTLISIYNGTVNGKGDELLDIKDFDKEINDIREEKVLDYEKRKELKEKIINNELNPEEKSLEQKLEEKFSPQIQVNYEKVIKQSTNKKLTEEQQKEYDEALDDMEPLNINNEVSKKNVAPKK